MTYSIVALDRATGDLGVAVQSKFLAVGAVVPWARAGVGAVATQAFANVAYGPDGLAFLADGSSAEERCDVWSPRQPARPSPGRHRRRARRCRDPHRPAVLRLGRWPGGRGFRGAGQHPGRRRASSTASPTRSWPAAGRSRNCSSRASRRPTRLVAIGAVASRRPCWSCVPAAATVVERPLSRPAGRPPRRSDRGAGASRRSAAPLFRAADAGGAARRSTRRPRPRSGASSSDSGRDRAAVSGPSTCRCPGCPRPSPRSGRSVGEPRELPPNWDATWQRALDDWMSVENLEERAAASGWIDRRVLEILRGARGG